MDPFWQVIIGSGIGGLLLEIYLLYKSYLKESAASNESQRMAKASIIFGLSGIILIFIGSIIGLVLGLLSMRGKKHKGLSIIGIIISVLTLTPWVLMLIFKR